MHDDGMSPQRRGSEDSRFHRYAAVWCSTARFETSQLLAHFTRSIFATSTRLPSIALIKGVAPSLLLVALIWLALTSSSAVPMCPMKHAACSAVSPRPPPLRCERSDSSIPCVVRRDRSAAAAVRARCSLPVGRRAGAIGPRGTWSLYTRCKMILNTAHSAHTHVTRGFTHAHAHIHVHLHAQHATCCMCKHSQNRHLFRAAAGRGGDTA